MDRTLNKSAHKTRRKRINYRLHGDIEVVPERDSQPINSPDDWWPMILGSGYRGAVDQLSPSELEQVRAENLEFIRREAIDSVEANVIYAIGKKH